MTSVHPACDNAGKTVTCDRCGRTYVCSPSDDYYCTPDGDHSCEPCLTRGMRVATVDVATCGKCRHSITLEPGEEHWHDVSGWEFCPKNGFHEPVLDAAPSADPTQEVAP